MMTAEHYEAIALEVMRACVSQLPLDVVRDIDGGWRLVANDVFNLTDAFVNELYRRLARNREEADIASREIPDTRYSGEPSRDRPSGG